MSNKIHLIYEHSGSYEDYSKDLIKAFFNKEKAKEFKKQKEKETKILEERYKNNCCNCAYGENYCELYKISNDPNDDIDCMNRIEYYDIDNLYYTLEEIEIE